MKVKGTATALATGTTKFSGSGAVWVFNTGSAQTITVRNAADNANVGTIYVGAGAGIVVHLDTNEGLRGDATLFGTEIVNAGF